MILIPILVGGCGEAVEILIRNPKRFSYNKFINSVFRFGECSGAQQKTRVEQAVFRYATAFDLGLIFHSRQLSAHLESPPYSISTVSYAFINSNDVEYHSKFVLPRHEPLRYLFQLIRKEDSSGNRLCLPVDVEKDTADVGTEGIGGMVWLSVEDPAEYGIMRDTGES
ncbi:hypothetical protein BDP27DRAFT_292687 [Rhodocollybia butyracea]|uniref:Uncharacterized protein n=1 Tax=Rhodocollybia butyracea TaxID=206335 RepID=A0A9P5PFG0_9AGAR|nr:hypothetical protein BDP27DRAFT_292687 [Rhodocollybia butyracea]